MISSKAGGFFMNYKIYAAEYKISLIEEFQSRNISMRAFCIEKELSLSTFVSWLKKIKMYGQPQLKMVPKTNESLLPIDVTIEAKAIFKEESIKTSNTFILETKGLKLTFSINNLKEVLEVINHD